MDRGLGKDIDAVLDLELFSLLFVLANGYGVEGILRPGIVPVNSRTVDDRWELSAPISERVTHRREGKHDVKSLTALLHKVAVYSLLSLVKVSLDGAFLQLLEDTLLVIRPEQVGNLTRVEQIVYVFQEGAKDNLRV